MGNKGGGGGRGAGGGKVHGVWGINCRGITHCISSCQWNGESEQRHEKTVHG